MFTGSWDLTSEISSLLTSWLVCKKLYSHVKFHPTAFRQHLFRKHQIGRFHISNCSVSHCESFVPKWIITPTAINCKHETDRDVTCQGSQLALRSLHFAIITCYIDFFLLKISQLYLHNCFSIKFGCVVLGH